MNASWLRADGADVVLTLHVQPGAKRTEIAGLHDAALKVRLAAPPVDGKANECLIGFLADALNIAKARVEVVSGAGSRAKKVRIGAMAAETVAQMLLPR